jgi:transporter family protein
MWLIYGLGSALFAGITSVLAKIGIKNVDSNLATALRTVVVLVFAWAMVLMVGSFDQIAAISGKSLLFLVLSGLTTGGSWICYFKALQLGDVNKVVPIDKSSTILTMLLAFLLLGEPISTNMILGMVAIGAGTYLMIQKQKGTAESGANGQWLVFALFSALFASLTSILGKIGIEGVESNLGTAIRTAVVLVMAWVVVFMTKGQKGIHRIDRKSWLFIGLSGLATGLSWMCYYKALQLGRASLVVPVDKLSILFTVGFAYLFLRETLNRRSLIGLVLLTTGTLLLLWKF